MKKTVSVKKLYEVVKRQENIWHIYSDMYGSENKNTARELTWYSAMTQMFFEATGEHWHRYDEEVKKNENASN